MTSEQYGKAYERYHSYTLRFLRARGVSYDAAEETVQAAWAKGWEYIAQLRNPDEIATWVNSIALNIHRTYIRQQQRNTTDRIKIRTTCRINLLAIDMRKLLMLTKYRNVMIQHYIVGLKVEEIAKKLPLPQGTIRVHLLRGRREIQKKMRNRSIRK